ncbi:hypothetical protein FOH38_06050 [Lysinibacillus fusiformis]|nr:hypothetical protein FOH38_06050 [Lysinibacillus fusiformis]
MKKYEESWQHLRKLNPSQQQQEKMLKHIKAPPAIKLQLTKESWKFPAVSVLFLVVLSVLILSILQGPAAPPLSTDTEKTIAKVYTRTNEDKETFIAKESCLNVPQQCFTNKQYLTMLQLQMEQAPNVTVSTEQWKASNYFSHEDVLIIFTDGTTQKWKVFSNDIFLNVQTQRAVQLERGFDSIAYYYDHFRSRKLVIANIFVLLSQLTLWIAKKRMPHTERRFFAATVEHAIANAVMLILFSSILFGIYLMNNVVHASIIFSLFTLYSAMQIYYRKKAGEPRGYLIASAIVQLCIGLGFTFLYISFNVHS